MCKNLFKGLFGGAAAPQQSATPQASPTVDTGITNATVLNPDVAGTSGTGKVKLGTAQTRKDNVAGLSI